MLMLLGRRLHAVRCAAIVLVVFTQWHRGCRMMLFRYESGQPQNANWSVSVLLTELKESWLQHYVHILTSAECGWKVMSFHMCPADDASPDRIFYPWWINSFCLAQAWILLSGVHSNASLSQVHSAFPTRDSCVFIYSAFTYEAAAGPDPWARYGRGNHVPYCWWALWSRQGQRLGLIQRADRVRGVGRWGRSRWCHWMPGNLSLCVSVSVYIWPPLALT